MAVTPPPSDCQPLDRPALDRSYGDRPVALTVAGTDSSGGAGVTADLKTFQALGVWGCAAITAVTAQNSQAVVATHLVPAEMIAAQIRAVLADMAVGAVKTGMLGSAEAVAAVSGALRSSGLALVIDPVVRSTSGQTLLSDAGLEALRTGLLPLATVLTPNLPEASALLDRTISDREGMEAAAADLLALGPEFVLIKGGHLNAGISSPDLLAWTGGAEWLERPRLASRHTHGTGCVLSAAITAALAQGLPPEPACRQAKAVVTSALAAAVALGHGPGSVDPARSGLFGHA